MRRCIFVARPIPSRGTGRGTSIATRRSRYAPVVVVLALLALLPVSGAWAQGFGGKGGGGHRGGGNRDAATAPCAPAAAAAAGDALAGFLATLRDLRTQLLLRADQTDAWTAMRDALLAYESVATAQAATAAEPLQRIKALTDSAQERAATLAKFDAAMDVLVAALDEPQRRLLTERLGSTFAAGAAPAAH